MNTDYTDFSSVDKLISEDIRNGYPGCVYSVIKDGKILKKSVFGYKNRYDRYGNELPAPEKMELDTVFDLASNTKIYATLYSIMKLVSDGLLDIDRPVKNYIPEYIHESVTPRNLLSHSSGYGPEIWFFDKKNIYGEKFYSLNREKTAELILKEVPLEYKTGLKSVYSDTGFMLLGILVEKISELRQDLYFKENISDKLFLNNTCFNPLQNGIDESNIAATSFGNSCNGTMDYPGIRKGVIRGEVQDEKAFYSMDGIAGHAGLFSNLDDVSVLVKLILDHGKFNDEELISPEVITAFSCPSEADNAFGYGWRILSHEKWRRIAGDFVNGRTLGHTGFTGTVTLVDIENSLGIVILTNKIHTKCLHRQDYMGNRYNTGKYHPIINEVYKCLDLNVG